MKREQSSPAMPNNWNESAFQVEIFATFAPHVIRPIPWLQEQCCYICCNTYWRV